jgi:hypothetical protein
MGRKGPKGPNYLGRRIRIEEVARTEESNRQKGKQQGGVGNEIGRTLG